MSKTWKAADRLKRYKAKVDERGPDDCWPWAAARDDSNYGEFADGKNGSMGAHRFGFAMLVRSLQPGEVIDHLCHSRDLDCPAGNACEHRACQNPAHWEAVTREVNNNRRRARRPYCSAGHEYTEENTYWLSRNRRQCKKCTNARSRARASDPAVKAARSARQKAERAARQR